MTECSIDEKVRRYVRTTITNEDGTITTARIDLSSGVIKPYKYRKKKRYEAQEGDFKFTAPTFPLGYGSEGDLLDYIPSWVNIPAPNFSDRLKQGYKPRVSKDNPNNVFLSEYVSYDEAVFDYSVLDDLFTGVSLLHDGTKNRPMNKGLMFNMLRDLDTINSETIQAYTGYSERHCRKLASYLRVLSNAFDMEVER